MASREHDAWAVRHAAVVGPLVRPLVRYYAVKAEEQEAADPCASTLDEETGKALENQHCHRVQKCLETVQHRYRCRPGRGIRVAVTQLPRFLSRAGMIGRIRLR